MAVAPAVRSPSVVVIRLMGVTAAALVITWATHFLGGNVSHLQQQGSHLQSSMTGMGMTAAMLAHKTISGTKNFKQAMHLTLQFFALCLAVIGVWATLKFHNDKGIGNFYSLHSWLGLACLLLYVIQWGIEFATCWYPGGSRHGRAILLPWHVFFGAYIYALAVATAVTGLLEKATFLQSSSIISRNSNEAFLINSLGMLLVLHGGFVVLPVISSGAVQGDAYNNISD